MRALLLAPLAVGVVAAGGVALCGATGRDAHVPSMINAAGACLLGVALGAVPLFLARRASQYAMTQAALVATMVHLFAAVGATAVLMLSGRLSQPYIYWVLPFYFATMVPLVIAATRAIRNAPPERAAAAPKA